MQLQSPAPIESSPLHAVEVPDPIVGQREVRVEVSCCAVCRTDLHVIERDLEPMKSPIIPGHQVVGVVDQLGPNCKRLKLGQRVGIAWLRHTCGQCRFCTRGRENLCEFSQYTGYHADGGYAEYATVPEDFAYEIPDGFNDDIALSPLLCAGIIGYRSLKRANLPKRGTLVLFGFGSSAHIVMQIALHGKCRVLVVTRSDSHQKLARDLGAHVSVGDVRDLRGEKANSAIVFAPLGALVPQALGALDRGGTISLAGIHMSPIPQIDYDRQLFQERDIHPVTANTRDDGRELLRAALEAGVKPRTTVYPLTEANRALLDLKQDRIDGTAVLTVAS